MRFRTEIKGWIVDPLDVKRRLTCIVAPDAVSDSRQMGQDEEATVRILSAHRVAIDGIIAFHGDWLRLEGQLQPDGSARRDAHGLTGDPK